MQFASAINLRSGSLRGSRRVPRAPALCVCCVCWLVGVPRTDPYIYSALQSAGQHCCTGTVSARTKNANPRQRKYRKSWKLACPLFSVAFVFWSLAIRGDSPLTTEPRSVFSTGTSSRAPSAEIWRKKTSLHLVLKLKVTLHLREYLTRLVAANPWLAIWTYLQMRILRALVTPWRLEWGEWWSPGFWQLEL